MINYLIFKKLNAFMIRKIIFFLFFFLIIIIFNSCKKSDSGGGTTPPPPPPPVISTLKDASSIPIGVGISYDLFKNNATYSALIKAQFDRITAEYQMKHGPNVKNDGTYDFSKTDDLVNLVQSAGLTIHGHTLAWHQNNNGTYLRSLSGSAGPNILLNPSFENGFTNWFTQVSSTAPTSGNISVETSDVQSGTQSAKIVVNTPGPNAFSIQVLSDNISVTNGSTYKFTYWAKSITNGQALRVVAQGTSYYAQADQALTTAWTLYTFTFTPTENSVSVKFHFPNAGTFYIDNLSVGTSSTVINSGLVKNALQSWITTIVTRYKGKVTGWDVANEVVVDGTGNLRTSANSSASGIDAFYWADYLGREYIADAFRWANAADPSAKLFINDYNLESDSRKLDSLIKIVNELQSANVPIHGIGIQMHVSINSNNSAIDNAFQKLVATGLLIHVSELDVRINPSNINPFTSTQALLDQQAQKYKYIVESYFRNVPAAQRYGITVWNVTDADSWIVTGGKQDAPTLFDNNFNKKPAYSGFLEALK